jgi:chemotaxis protein MotB
MFIRHGRLIAPVVVFLLASGCSPSAQKTIDNLRYQVRSQQHVIAGHTRDVENLAAERDALNNKLQEQGLLLDVYKKKADDAETALTGATSALGEAKSALDLALTEKTQIEKSLQERLQELAQGDPDLEYDPKTGSLSVAAEVLFNPGKSELRTSGLKALNKVAPVLKQGDHLIRIDGHTDSDPIRRSKWDDNWQLAAERARQVLKVLIKQGVPKDRIFFAAFADTRPRATNKTTAGKKQNRRVELVPLQEGSSGIPLGRAGN